MSEFKCPMKKRNVVDDVRMEEEKKHEAYIIRFSSEVGGNQEITHCHVELLKSETAIFCIEDSVCCVCV